MKDMTSPGDDADRSTPSPSLSRALVLGGGGVTGIAWETGLLHGLAAAGVDVTSGASAADLVVGTSAGSVVGAQVRSGTSLADLYAAQTTPPRPDAPRSSISPLVLLTYARGLLLARGDLERFGRHLGAYAVRRAAAGRTPTLEERYIAIRGRLSSYDWPTEPLRITVVDAETGRLRVLDGSDPDVTLLDAVAASCAVPGVYPPVPIGGGVYVDGGARSGTNADLAADHDRVLVLAPVDRSVGPMRAAPALLRGVHHLVLAPDDASRSAIGRNVLDPAAKVASARAGHAQGLEAADDVRELWG